MMESSVSSSLILFLESFFAGFALVIPIIALIKTSSLKTIQFKNIFILQAVQAVRLGGIVYALLALIPFLLDLEYTSPTPGVYYLYRLFIPVMYLVLTQCFWFKKLYIKKAALVILCVLLLILPTQRFISFISTFYRDYLPSNWFMYQGSFFLRIALNVVVFFFTVVALIFLSGKQKSFTE